jgi:hypothetical protein
MRRGTVSIGQKRLISVKYFGDIHFNVPLGPFLCRPIVLLSVVKILLCNTSHKWIICIKSVLAIGMIICQDKVLVVGFTYVD